MSRSRIGRLILVGGVAALGMGGMVAPAVAAGEPAPPMAVTARASNGQAVVSWTASGGATVTKYVATTSGGQTCETTGEPAGTTCTVTGLTNDTAYTVTVTAANAAGTSAPSTASSSVIPRAGTPDVNVIGTYGRVKWNQATVGATDSTRTWPTMIYSSPYPWVADQVYDQSGPAPADCTTAWLWTQILCDPTPSANSKTAVAKPGGTFDVGYTIDTDLDPTVAGYVVIDLQQPRDFTTLRIWQMFSDGKVTNVELAASSSAGDTYPAHDDGTWTTVVPKSSVGPSKKVAASEVTECPTILDFSATRARYLRLRSWNDGSFGAPSWIEIGAAKLFFEQTPALPETACPPSAPTDVSVVAGDAQGTVSWTPPREDVTGYSLKYTTNPQLPISSWLTLPTEIPGTASSYSLTGLTNGTTYYVRLKALNATNDPDAASPWSMVSNAFTPTASPVPPVPPEPTVLKVKAAKAGKIRANRRTTLVKSVRTDGRLTKVRAWCELAGNPLRGRVADRLCGLTVKRPAAAQAVTTRNVRITAAPTCSRKLRIYATISAKKTGADRATWRDSWKVAGRPPITCRIKATG